jgi:hypothetical protein
MSAARDPYVRAPLGSPARRGVAAPEVGGRAGRTGEDGDAVVRRPGRRAAADPSGPAPRATAGSGRIGADSTAGRAVTEVGGAAAAVPAARRPGRRAVTPGQRGVGVAGRVGEAGSPARSAAGQPGVGAAAAPRPARRPAVDAADSRAADSAAVRRPGRRAAAGTGTPETVAAAGTRRSVAAGTSGFRSGGRPAPADRRAVTDRPVTDRPVTDRPTMERSAADPSAAVRAEPRRPGRRASAGGATARPADVPRRPAAAPDLSGVDAAPDVSGADSAGAGGRFGRQPVVSRVAAGGPQVSAPRTPFVLLVLGVLVVGLVSLLLLNSALAGGSFAQRRLQRQNSDLSLREQELTREISAMEAPGALASAASKLGLVPSGQRGFLIIDKDGHAHIAGTAVPATKPPPPPPPPPSPTGSTPTVSSEPGAANPGAEPQQGQPATPTLTPTPGPPQ